MITTNDKSECQSLSMQEMVAPSPKNDIDYRKHRGVRQTKSGKWGATIRHPITKIAVWLGSYNTPKEAADVYIEKKLEYQAVSVDEMEACIPTTATAADFGKHLGTICTNSSKRGAKFRLVNLEADFQGLGSSLLEGRRPTSKAEASVNQKMEELVSRAHPELEKRQHEEHDLRRMCGCITMGKQFQGLSKSVNRQLTCKQDTGKEERCRPRGVYQRKSGRWFAEIRNPITNVRFSVGTYDTAEETLEILKRKRLEFASIVCAEKQCKLSNFVAEEDLALDDIISDHESNMNVENVQLPYLTHADSEEFGMGVINAYGQLVGEFSKLDDELWLGGPLDDDDAHIG